MARLESLGSVATPYPRPRPFHAKHVWFCLACGALGVCVIYDPSDIWTVAMEIAELHRQASPCCHGRPRVLNLDAVQTSVVLVNFAPGARRPS